jgi:hypothetical protein
MRATVSTDRADPDDGRPSSKEVFVAGVSALLLSAFYVVMAAWHGALGVSRSDDWVYFREAFRLARQGTFTGDPWAGTMLVGHLVLAQPVIAIFGSSLAALQLMVSALGALALTATYLVVRSFLSRGRAAFSIGCLALGPVYGTLSVSYMTDVPALSLEALVLLAGLYALRSSRFSFSWFAASLVLGVAAFSIREYALAAPAAVSLVAVRRLRGQDRAMLSRVAVAVSVCFVLVAGMYLWRQSLPGVSHVARPTQPLLISVAYVCSAAFTISLFAFPMLPLISVRAAAQVLHDSGRRALVATGFIVLVWAALAGGNAVLVGNFLTPYGSYSETLPGRPPVVVPTVLWRVLTVISLFSLLSFFVVALAGRRRPDPLHDPGTARPHPSGDPAGLQLAWVFCLMMFGGLMVVKIATPGVISDRYLIPIVPFLIAVALHRAAKNGLLVRPVRPVAIASIAMMAVLGTTVVDAVATFDGAKWQLATSVQQRGFAPASIDGGYEWFGFHQPGEIVDFALNAPARNWWNRIFVRRSICVETRNAAAAPAGRSPDQGKVVRRLAARTLFGVEYDLVALRTTEPCASQVHQNLTRRPGYPASFHSSTSRS